MLHEADSYSYPLLPENPDYVFITARNRHSVVFSVKEANKLRKVLRRMQKEKDKEAVLKQREENRQALQKERKQALRNIEEMRKDIEYYSKRKDKELSEAVKKTMTIVETMCDDKRGKNRPLFLQTLTLFILEHPYMETQSVSI